MSICHAVKTVITNDAPVAAKPQFAVLHDAVEIHQLLFLNSGRLV